jgi:outer membrane biosynthesis protein TonB
MVEERATGSVPAFTDASPREPQQADATMGSARFGSQSSGNFFTRLFGGGKSEDEKPQAVAAPSAAPAPASKAAPVRTATAAPKPPPKAEPKAESRQEARAQPAQPKPQPARPSAQQTAQAQPEQPAAAAAAPTSANAGGLILGAQPVVPAGSFESRWGAMR